MTTGLIVFTRLPIEDVENRLKVNSLPTVIVSENGPDYTNLCEKYKVCYIHSGTDVSYYGLNEETIPVILNRICMGAAALNVDSVLIWVNCCQSFALSKTHIINNIATNKNNIVSKYKGRTDVTYAELFKDLKEI